MWDGDVYVDVDYDKTCQGEKKNLSGQKKLTGASMNLCTRAALLTLTSFTLQI